MLPRTRQTERVRATIITHRNQSLQNQESEGQNAAFEGNNAPADGNQAGPSTSRISSNSAANRKFTTRTRKPKKKKKYKSKYKITYEIDEATGEKITVKTKKRRYRRKKKKRKVRTVTKPKTVKKRLALQLGMLPAHQAGQVIPETRNIGPSNIGFQRSQAGIPALHLFGQNDLDYFSYSNSDDEGGNMNVLIRRRPTMSDAAVLRRAARRKAFILNEPVTSSSDILGSILDSQQKFHAKNSILSLNADGSVKVDINKQLINENNNRLNLDNYNNKLKQTPMDTERNTANTPPNTNNSREYTNRTSSTEYQNNVTTSLNTSVGSIDNFQEDDQPNRSLTTINILDAEKQNKKEKNEKETNSISGENTPYSAATPNSDSELDIYSDIETVSTSRVEDFEIKSSTSPTAEVPQTLTDDDDANTSDADLVIDTEKVENLNRCEPERDEKEVSSTVDAVPDNLTASSSFRPEINSSTEIQSETVQSSNQNELFKETLVEEEEDDDDLQDGCPNFSIYSTESMTLAKNTDLNLLNNHNFEKASEEQVSGTNNESAAPEKKEEEEKDLKTENNKNERRIVLKKTEKETATKSNALYSDSEDESVIKMDPKKPFGIGDISNMTEDISEEERSYTPCLDEKEHYKEGIEGLDTEMISDEEKNDFDESHELKTISDGDALEINAKESELDFTKPDDYEEGEIVDKLKKMEQSKKNNEEEEEIGKEKVTSKNKDKESKNSNKENESGNKDSSFKKLSKSNKERNYREKDKSRERSKSKDKKDKSNKENKKEKEKKKDKRREIPRYNVRSMIAEKPKKDRFGRDESRRRSMSQSTRSLTPTRRSTSRARRSVSRDKSRKRRGRSRERRSISRSRSRSYEYRRSRSRNRRQRSASKNKYKSRRKSRDRSKTKKKKRSRTASPRRKREWERRHSRGWSPSPSRSYTPEPRKLTPSWTPPRVLEKQPVKPHNLTVILTNDASKKKKEKKKKAEKKTRETLVEKTKKRKRDRTPAPSKEVFASGDNILVSVSFNKENNHDTNKKKRENDEITTKRTRKEKRLREKSPKPKKKKSRDVSGIKPVAIIDLERSPFKELTPSPLDVIILTDSENGEVTDMHTLQKAMCDSSQQVVSPECSISNNYTTGPKTPPEPQIKFSLNSKQAPLRAINNPLHEPDDVEGEVDPQEELEQRLNDVLHKGPNTPPEPPNSPPSSPDAYDPFDPTKSRSPTPEPQNNQMDTAQNIDGTNEIENRSDNQEKSALQTGDVTKAHSPTSTGADIQAADSQSSIRGNSPDSKSPECSIGVVINQVVQIQTSTFNTSTTKPAAPTTAYSSSSSIVTSTPTIANLTPRVNILSSTVLTSNVVSSVPQRIVLPNTTKSSPVKVSPSKPPIKSTPIKPMPAKNIMSKNNSNKSNRKSVNRNQNGNDVIDVLDFDSPYSPGSSDYEDLFEPPVETSSKSNKPVQSAKNTKSPVKMQSTFDNLFGSSPTYNTNKKKTKAGKKSHPNKGLTILIFFFFREI